MIAGGRLVNILTPGGKGGKDDSLTIIEWVRTNLIYSICPRIRCWLIRGADFKD